MDKIAIVDDNLLFRKITHQILEKIGYSKDCIIMLENGKVAFDFILNNIHDNCILPKTILLDLNMPIINGWEFLELLKDISSKFKYNPDIHIITSSVDSKDIAHAKSIHQINGYLIKPVKSDDIKRILELNTEKKTRYLS